MKRFLYVVLAVLLAAGLFAGGLLFGRGTRPSAAPSPTPSRSAQAVADPCTLSPRILHAYTDSLRAWNEASRQAKGHVTTAQYQAAYRRAIGKITVIRANLQRMAVPTDPNLREARARQLQVLSRLLGIASIVAVSSTYNRPALEVRATEANALEDVVDQRLAALHCPKAKPSPGKQSPSPASG